VIPKKIHYCWLSGEKIPSFLKKCMDTWRQVMPEYEYILWDKERFDIFSVPFVEDAYKTALKTKHWGPAADYIRLYALYSEGGIYLDTDVIVRKSFNDLLKYDFFTAHEWWELSINENKTLALINDNGTPKENILQRMHGVGIQAAILGSIPKHPLLKDLLEWYKYQRLPYINLKKNTSLIAPDIYAFIARKYGYKYKDQFQELNENLVIFPSCFFPNSIGKAVKESYAIHLAESIVTFEKGIHRLYRTLSRNDFIRKIMGKPSYFNKILEEIDNTIAQKNITV
jgi:hypothetical protein